MMNGSIKGQGKVSIQDSHFPFIAQSARVTATIIKNKKKIPSLENNNIE